MRWPAPRKLPRCFVGRVGGLERLLPGPERVDLRLQALTGVGESLLLPQHGGTLLAQGGELLLDRRLAGSRFAGYVLPPGINRVLALPGEFRGCLLELADLQLDALPRGRHVGDAAAYLLQGFQLALVGVVERFPGVFRCPEHGFQRHDQWRAEGLTRLQHRQPSLADEAGEFRLGAAQVSEPVTDLGVHPELVAHDGVSLVQYLAGEGCPRGLPALRRPARSR